MDIKGKQVGGKVTKQATASDLYSDYLKAGKNSALQNKTLSQIIKFVIQDPESKYSETLIKIAKKGDSRCSSAIEPLMDIFWEGDFEWQEEIVHLLGEIAYLAPLALRVKVGMFLGHVAVSPEFVGGSGVDHAATVALDRIGAILFNIERSKIDMSKPVEIRDSHRLFDAETRSAAK